MQTRTLPPEVDARETLKTLAEAFGLTIWFDTYWKVEIVCPENSVCKSLGKYYCEKTASRLVELLNKGCKKADIAELSGPHKLLVIELGDQEGGVA